MADTSNAYALDASTAELRRLQQQNDAVGLEARWLFDRLELKPGQRVLEVACGPAGCMEMFSERVGPEGAVLGLDVNPAMVARAQDVAARTRHRNIQVVQADAAATGLPRASFDVVHARLLLINVPRPAPIVAEMAALVRPGGVVALQEIDGASWGCEPAHPSWDALYSALLTVFAQDGCDTRIGRRLPSLLRAAGLADVRAEAHARVHTTAHPWRLLLLQFAEVIRERVVTRGLLRHADIDAHKAALKAHLDDPLTVVFAPVLCQAWARRPEEL